MSRDTKQVVLRHNNTQNNQNIQYAEKQTLRKKWPPLRKTCKNIQKPIPKAKSTDTSSAAEVTALLTRTISITNI